MKLAFLFVLLFSCSSPTIWKLEENHADHSSYRIYQTQEDTFFGLEFEMLNIEDKLYCYLNSPTQKISSVNDQLAEVTVIINERSYIYTCPILKGNQSVYLNNEISKKLINSLKEKNRVHITIGKLRATLDPDDSFFQENKKATDGISFLEQVLNKGAIL